MLSTRLLKLIFTLTKFISFFGIIPVSFCPSTGQFHHHHSSTWKPRTNFCFLTIWIIAGIAIIFKYNRLGNVDRFNVSIAFWLAVVLTSIAFLIPYYFGKELIVSINGLFVFTQYLKRKLHK